MLHTFGLSFVGIFVALDIIGILPMFLGLTHQLSRPKKKEVINTSICVALIVALVFGIVGNSLFKYLGTSISDFRIAGGLVLLLVSLADLLSGPDSTKRGSGST